MNIRHHASTLLLIALTGLLFTGCKEEDDQEKIDLEKRLFDLYMGSHYPDAVPDANGLYYIEFEEGTGARPDTGDWVKINYVGYVLPSEIVVDTYLENVASNNSLNPSEIIWGPLKMQVQSKSEGVQEGLKKMKAGGKATFCFTSDLGYGSKGGKFLQSIPAYNSLKYEMELLEVIPDIESYEAQRLQAYVDTIPGVDTIHDPATDAIMYYVVDNPNDTGRVIGADSLVSVVYRGSFIDGRVFDENDSSLPYEVVIGADNESGSSIAGWNMGLQRFKNGEKGRMFIPWQIAYGEEGVVKNNVVSMPAYENLIFEVEVVAVETASDDKDPEE